VTGYRESARPYYLRRTAMSLLRVTVTLLATICVALVGCDGDDGGNGDDLTASRTAAAGTTPSLFDADETPRLEGTAQELASLLQRGLVATYRVRYEKSSEEGTADDAYVVYNRGSLTRIDTVTREGDTPQHALLARAGSTTVNCTPDSDGGWDCERIPALGSTLLRAAGPVIYPTAGELSEGEVHETEGRTIAGTEARCFEVTQDGQTEPRQEYCVSAEGVVVYAFVNEEETEATELSAEVTDADFVLLD
jgi:hypothetical protein